MFQVYSTTDRNQTQVRWKADNIRSQAAGHKDSGDVLNSAKQNLKTLPVKSGHK